MRETAWTVLGAAGLSVAAAVDTPGRFVSDAVVIASIAALTRIVVALINRGRSERRSARTRGWGRLGRWARLRAVAAVRDRPR